MIPNMYKMAGELLPSVIHVSARAVASHALSIFGDHSDVMACRQTGYAMLCSSNPQEVMDLGAVAHLSAIKGRVPFLHFFDGFRTSHEIQKIETWDYDDLASMIDHEALAAFRARALNPENPILRGTAQNPDIFFQAREASNKYYLAVPAIVEDYMNQINAKTGSNYKLFNYYGAPDAEKIIVAMGSVCDTVEETVDYLISKGEKVGLVKVRLYRPFSVKHFISEIPRPLRASRLWTAPKSRAQSASLSISTFATPFAALSSRTPLSSAAATVSVQKDTTPSDIIAVFRNLESDNPKTTSRFLSKTTLPASSLPVTENPDTVPAGTISCKFWGIGSDGTVGANKNSIMIIGDHTDKKVQAYFAYDSKSRAV